MYKEARLARALAKAAQMSPLLTAEQYVGLNCETRSCFICVGSWVLDSEVFLGIGDCDKKSQAGMIRSGITQKMS